MRIDGAKLRAMREKMPMSAHGFAEVVGVSAQTIHRIEREGTARYKTLVVIAEKLGVPLKKLV